MFKKTIAKAKKIAGTQDLQDRLALKDPEEAELLLGELEDGEIKDSLTLELMPHRQAVQDALIEELKEDHKKEIEGYEQRIEDQTTEHNEVYNSLREEIDGIIEEPQTKEGEEQNIPEDGGEDGIA